MDLGKVALPSDIFNGWKGEPLPTEYVGLLSSVCMGLSYKSDGKTLLELAENDEEVLFVFLTEIIKAGVVGKNRRCVKTKTGLKSLQNDIEKFTSKVKKGEVEGSSLGYYGIVTVDAESKEGKKYEGILVDLQSVEEMYLWFENHGLKVTVTGAILTDVDKEASEKNFELGARVEQIISELEPMSDDLKKEVLNTFLNPFRYDDRASIETKLMYLSTSRKYINIMRGSIWHMIPTKDRIFGGCWTIDQGSLLTNKEAIFNDLCINALIDKYI